MLIFLGLVLIAAAIGYLGKVISMLDFSRLNAALVALGAAVSSVADAIRNPQVDNASQNNIDAMAGKLEEVADTLEGLGNEETAMDNADAATEVEPVDDASLDTSGGSDSADTGAGSDVGSDTTSDTSEDVPEESR